MTETKKRKKHYYLASYISKQTRIELPKQFKTKREAEAELKRQGATKGVEIKKKEVKPVNQTKENVTA
jgi:hypothetical protein